MLKLYIFISFLFVSNIGIAQKTAEVVQFDKSLNQFLNVRDFTISEDQTEAYFTIQSPAQDISQIVSINRNKNGWSEPEILPFCDSYMYLEPFLSRDGNRLFFVSDRPLSNSGSEKKDFDIWYVERRTKTEKWSKPINVGKPVNSHLDEFYPSLAENKNLYFTMASPDGMGKDDIYVSKWENDRYAEPVLLNENINSKGYEFNAFISKKEDYLLYTKYNEADGLGSGDLYIAKKNQRGQWKKAVNLGATVNTKYMEYCPFYDEKKGVLYLTSRRNNLIPKKFKDVSDFQEYIREGNNGLSKIYKIGLKLD